MLVAFRISADFSLESVLEESRYNFEEKSEIRRVFEDADKVGIHEGLLLPRVQEAQAKRVPAERLVLVLEGEIDRLTGARAIILNTQGAEALLLADAGWQRTANLIAWGATEEEIQSLIRCCPQDATAYLESSYLFTSLVEWGLDREVSLRLVAAVAGSQIDVDEYPGVFEVLINGRRLKMQPAEIAERMIVALDAVENLRQLERMVLHVR